MVKRLDERESVGVGGEKTRGEMEFFDDLQKVVR